MAIPLAPSAFFEPVMRFRKKKCPFYAGLKAGNKCDCALTK
jgi:hypothetical protein